MLNCLSFFAALSEIPFAPYDPLDCCLVSVLFQFQILFQFKSLFLYELIWCTNYPNSYFSLALKFYLRVLFLCKYPQTFQLLNHCWKHSNLAWWRQILSWCVCWFEKAFDTTDHNILLLKLDQYGVRGTANEWLAQHLKNRK